MRRRASVQYVCVEQQQLGEEESSVLSKKAASISVESVFPLVLFSAQCAAATSSPSLKQHFEESLAVFSSFEKVAFSLVKKDTDIRKNATSKFEKSALQSASSRLASC